ncbi:MAG: DUF2269 family protein [Acidimicrobiia bacterium]
MENTLLYVHILCAAIWLGGAVFNAIFLLSTKQLTTAQAKPILQNISNLGKFVFAPISALVLISGIGLISVANWSFSDSWISMAFTGIIISIILGSVFHPRAGRKALSAAQSDNTQEMTAAIKSWLIIAYIDLVVIAGILAVMVFKPGA